MRRRDLLPLVLLGGIAAFIVVQGRQMGRDRLARRAAGHNGSAPAPAATAAPARQQGSVEGGDASASTVTARPARTVDVAPPAELRASEEPAPVRDDAVIREQIRENEAGTYIRAILERQQQLLMRWPQRQREALRVWISRDVSLRDWNPGYPVVAERAFDEWKEAGFPLRFDIVTDRVNADILIQWVDRFPASDGRRIGVTSKARDQSGWLVSAEISIAMHDSAGAPLPPEVVAGVARHEIGHALGLDHSRDSTDVMYPESTTSVISAADRATLHLLYMLPPGVVK